MVSEPPLIEIMVCPLKRDHTETILKGNTIFQPSIFRGYVSFQGVLLVIHNDGIIFRI